MNRENWPAALLFIIFPIAIFTIGSLDKSLFDLIGALFMATLSAFGVVAAIAALIEKSFVSAAFYTFITFYWFVPITIDSF